MRPRVVILGGGFAGLAAARELRDEPYRVTLVDPKPDFAYWPNLHELVSRVKRPRDLRLPHRQLLTRWGHAFLRDRAVEIDPVARRVRTAGGVELGYDALLVATGSRTATHDVPGVREHALGLRSVPDARAIGKRLKRLAKSGERSVVTIVGGGYIGVEVLGEILRRYRRRRELAVRIIDPGKRLLGGLPKVISRQVRTLARDFDVTIRTRETVVEVAPGRVVLESGSTLRSDLTIWAAGAEPQPLLARAGLAEPGEWAGVRKTLQSVAYDDVFVLGDSARFPGGIAKQSYHAEAMGERAVRNLDRLFAGRKLERFKPQPEQFLITFGYLSGFYYDGDVVVEGAALCLGREALYQLGMWQLDRPGSAKSARRKRERILSALEPGSIPRPLSLFLPFPYARLPRDVWDLPSLPRILEIR